MQTKSLLSNFCTSKVPLGNSCYQLFIHKRPFYCSFIIRSSIWESWWHCLSFCVASSLGRGGGIVYRSVSLFGRGGGNVVKVSQNCSNSFYNFQYPWIVNGKFITINLAILATMNVLSCVWDVENHGSQTRVGLCSRLGGQCILEV
jgi:hypothetical protein